MDRKKHSRDVKSRYFRIWQLTGEKPFQKQNVCPCCGRPLDQCNHDSKFFKGAFDSIPFMNDDAKRTIVHLLLRPGFMIKDYLNGKNNKYLAPLPALIIFYAFFSFILSIMNPGSLDNSEVMEINNSIIQLKLAQTDSTLSDVTGQNLVGVLSLIKDCYVWLNLDRFPEEVHTRSQATLAAVESNLRSQGVPQFLGKLLLLSLSIWIVTRKKYEISISAASISSAYILCQFCFIMILITLLTLGTSSSVGLLVMCTVMTIDFSQLLGIYWRKALRLSIGIGVLYGFLVTLFLLLSFAVIVAVQLK